MKVKRSLIIRRFASESYAKMVLASLEVMFPKRRHGRLAVRVASDATPQEFDKAQDEAYQMQRSGFEFDGDGQ